MMTPRARTLSPWAWVLPIGIGSGVAFGHPLATSFAVGVAVTSVFASKYFKVRETLHDGLSPHLARRTMGLPLLGISTAVLYLIPNRAAFLSFGSVAGVLRLSTIPILLALAVALPFLHRRPGLDRGYLFLGLSGLFLVFVGASVGMIGEARSDFLLGDTWKLALSCGILILRGPTPVHARRILFSAGAIAVLVDGVWLLNYVYSLLQGSYTRAGGGSVLTVAAGVALLYSRRRAHELWGLVVVGGGLLVAVLSLSRGTTLAAVVACVPIVWAPISPRWKTALPMVMIGVGLIAVQELPDQVLNPIGERFSFGERDEVLQQGSFVSRGGEIGDVMATIRTDPVVAVIGAGSGAELDRPSLGIRDHQIHVTPYSVLFRHGFIGLAWVTLLYGSLLARSTGVLRRVPRRVSQVEVMAASLILGTLVLSLSTYVLIGQPLVFLAAIAIGRSNNSSIPEGQLQ